jgi:hypothetical protein
MKANEVIEKIKVMLGVELKKHQFEATKTLVDGTTEVYVEGEFTTGEALFVITEEGLIPAPQGSHETNDGFKVEVDDKGIITSIEPVEGEPLPQIEEVEANEHYDDEKPEDMVIINETTENELVNAVVEAIKPLIDEIVEMKKELGKYKEKMEKFSKEPASNPIKANEAKDEFESPFQKRLRILTENKKSV